jgi:hypothetical protein
MTQSRIDGPNPNAITSSGVEAEFRDRAAGRSDEPQIQRREPYVLGAWQSCILGA